MRGFQGALPSPTQAHSSRVVVHFHTASTWGFKADRFGALREALSLAPLTWE